MSAAPAFGVSPSDISSDNPPQNGGPSPKVASPAHSPLHTHLGRNGEMCANQKASMANGTTTTSNMGSGLEGGGAAKRTALWRTIWNLIGRLSSDHPRDGAAITPGRCLATRSLDTEETEALKT
ncbi:hypothetical protein KOW79_019048 [Hemibagrus wyckioides]|uniref:Uncharacterized protein n=1 Tax=Hemibagrus wyckioides TaxID=337641 RepID=A0A9D3NAZ1_9TELE|nr:hypothetical protein KOW79_019048 [Hemibagrus wyckioides]